MLIMEVFRFEHIRVLFSKRILESHAQNEG